VVRVPRRNVDQTARDSEGALFDGLAHEPRLLPQFFGLEPAGAFATNRASSRAQAHEGRDVECDAAALDAGEEIVEVAPRRLRTERGQRYHRGSAVPGDLGRHALTNLALAPSVGQPQLI
jgi:hypothetical protein